MPNSISVPHTYVRLSYFIVEHFSDHRYLFSFLRARKFSQLGARDLLENYWTVRTRLKDWYEAVDSGDNKIQEIIRQG